MKDFAAGRSSAAERMDNPEADEAQLIRTLRQFTPINVLFSASRRLLKRHFLPRMEANTAAPYTLLDIGAGGCDTALWLSDYCARRNISIRITCIDNDPRIAAYARRKTGASPRVEMIEMSAFDIERLGTFDFIFSNHFMHHLHDSELSALLELVHRSTAIRFLMNDLARSKSSYLGFSLFAALFLHRSFAGEDGRISIRRAFSLPELQGVVRRSPASHRMYTGTAFPGRLFILGNGSDPAED